MRAGGGPPVLCVDPSHDDELAIVAIEARRNPSIGEDVVTMGLLDRPGGATVAVLYGSPDGLKALAEAVIGALGLLGVAPEGSVDYVARIGEPRRD